MRRALFIVSLPIACARPTTLEHSQSPPDTSVEAATPTPAPDVVVVNGATPGSFSIQVGLVGAVELSTYVEIQREVDGGFVPSGVTDVVLTTACDPDLALRGGRSLARCTTLPGGTTLTPPPFTGMGCASQCNMVCHWNAPVTPGTFRFVVTSCDGKRRFEGPAFVMTEPRK